MIMGFLPSADLYTARPATNSPKAIKFRAWIDPLPVASSRSSFPVTHAFDDVASRHFILANRDQRRDESVVGEAAFLLT